MTSRTVSSDLAQRFTVKVMRLNLCVGVVARPELTLLIRLRNRAAPEGGTREKKKRIVTSTLDESEKVGCSLSTRERKKIVT